MAEGVDLSHPMGERRGMKALELWCRRITKGYPGVRITNMTTSWRNGLGFCAIIHHFRPDLIDFDSLVADDVYKNNALAFETAETSLSIPALLDPQDMVDYEVPDRLSILTYVSQYYQCFVGQTGVPRKSTSDSEASVSPEPAPSPAAEKIGGRVEKTAAVLAHERAVLAGPEDDPLANAADSILERTLSQAETLRRTLERGLAGLAGAGEGPAAEGSSDSESDSDSSDEEASEASGVGQSTGETQSAGGAAELKSESEGVKSESGEHDGEVADRASDARVDTDSSVRENENAPDENEPDDVVLRKRVGDGSVTDLASSSHHPADNVETENSSNETAATSSEKSEIITEDSSEASPKRISIVQLRMQQFAAKEKPQPQPAPRRHPKPVQSAEEMEPEPPVPAERSKASADEEDQSREDAGNSAVKTEAEPPMVQKTTPSPPAEPPNPFDEDDDDEAAAVEPPAEEAKPPVVVAVTEPTPEKPAVVKEYNPFDDDEDEEPEAVAEEQLAVSKPEPPENQKGPTEEDEYPDDLNPFGEDDEGGSVEPSATPIPPKKPPRVKPVSLNPFGDSDEEEEEEVKGSATVTPTPSHQSSPAKGASPREINPFEKPPRPPPPTLDRRMLAARAGASPSSPRRAETSGLNRDQRSGSLTSLTSSSGKKKRPAPRPPGPAQGSPSSSLGVSPMGSPATLRKRHAPPPPPPPIAVESSPSKEPEAPPSPERSKAEKEQSNYTKMNLTNKSTEGKYKRRKGPAPLRPKPIKRQVKTLPPKETQTELHDINIKQLELERQGVELEKTIRQLTEQEAKQQKELDSTAPYGLDIEDMILQLFDLVNEKNALFRRQAELMYMRRQHRLEEEHAELEYEIRCLMMKADSLKTVTEREREQKLIDRLVSVVEQRNEIVTMLEMERIREIQEDSAIDYHMGLYTERVSSTEPVPEKKKKEKKKKKKKDKEAKKEKEGGKKKKSRDADKDIDEKEQAATPEKKKSKKMKLKKLFL